MNVQENCTRKKKRKRKRRKRKKRKIPMESMRRRVSRATILVDHRISIPLTHSRYLVKTINRFGDPGMSKTLMEVVWRRNTVVRIRIKTGG